MYTLLSFRCSWSVFSGEKYVLTSMVFLLPEPVPEGDLLVKPPLSEACLSMNKVWFREVPLKVGIIEQLRRRWHT